MSGVITQLTGQLAQEPTSALQVVLSSIPEDVIRVDGTTAVVELEVNVRTRALGVA